jgi:hypothetical protein
LAAIPAPAPDRAEQERVMRQAELDGIELFDFSYAAVSRNPPGSFRSSVKNLHSSEQKVRDKEAHHLHEQLRLKPPRKHNVAMLSEPGLVEALVAANRKSMDASYAAMRAGAQAVFTDNFPSFFVLLMIAESVKHEEALLEVPGLFQQFATHLYSGSARHLLARMCVLEPLENVVRVGPCDERTGVAVGPTLPFFCR